MNNCPGVLNYHFNYQFCSKFSSKLEYSRKSVDERNKKTFPNISLFHKKKTGKENNESSSKIHSEKQQVEKEKEKEPTEPPPITPSISKNAVMSLFSPITKSPPGPCKYLDGNRKQNHQCRRDIGLPEAIKEARRLALSHCQEQFRFDRWNCSIETRGKRNIFKKVSEIVGKILVFPFSQSFFPSSY